MKSLQFDHPVEREAVKPAERREPTVALEDCQVGAVEQDADAGPIGEVEVRTSAFYAARLAWPGILIAVACGHIGYDVGASGEPGDSGPVEDAREVDGAGAMVAVAAGPFTMGCDTEADTSCTAEELPLHAVTLAAFEIDRTEVTQAAYERCVAADACLSPAGDFAPAATPEHPVSSVTWDDARAYCEWAGKRLPTEAEWEKAARGTDGRLYPWGNTLPDCTRLNYDRCIDAITTVGSYPSNASPYGALDLAGNVSEWTADWYSVDYYASSPAEDPSGPDSGQQRVVRGSSYAFDAIATRASNRIEVLPGSEIYGRGFRCAR